MEFLNYSIYFFIVLFYDHLLNPMIIAPTAIGSVNRSFKSIVANTIVITRLRSSIGAIIDASPNLRALK